MDWYKRKRVAPKTFSAFSLLLFILATLTLFRVSKAEAQEDCRFDHECKTEGICDCSYCEIGDFIYGECVHVACEGQTCAEGDSCTYHVCEGFECVARAVEGGCLIDDECYTEGEPNPSHPCQICSPSVAREAWTPAEDGSAEQACYTCEETDTRGVGECKAGVQLCESGDWGACEGQICPDEEICDGLDNDCDGETDESFPERDQHCETDEAGCQADGIWICSEEEQKPICSGGLGYEICDGFDNDCDGATDEDFENLAAECSVGVGACTSDGVFICDEEHVQTICSAVEGEAVDEICDGVDNDCDGETDEEDGEALCVDDTTCTTDSCGGLEGCRFRPVADGTACTLGAAFAAACFGGICQEIPENDLCRGALRLTANKPEHAFLSEYANVLPPYDNCEEMTLTGRDVFFLASLEAGELYRLTLRPNRSTDISMIFWEACASQPVCLEVIDEAGLGEAEAQEFEPEEARQFIVQVIAPYEASRLDTPFTIELKRLLIIPDGDLEALEESELLEEEGEVEGAGEEAIEIENELEDELEAAEEAEAHEDETREEERFDEEETVEIEEVETVEIELESDADTEEYAELDEMEELVLESEDSGDEDSDRAGGIVDGDETTGSGSDSGGCRHLSAMANANLLLLFVIVSMLISRRRFTSK